MSDFLAAIARERRERIDRDAAVLPTSELRRRAEARTGDRRAFAAALRRPAGERLRVIAEVKRASPSAGLLREHYDPAGIAEQYARLGAAVISVLTEPSRFQGSVGHLALVREAVEVPVLLKDFVVHERQLFEARAHGADAALLIVSLLSPTQLRDYASLAREIGLETLVEIHEAGELGRALEVEGVIGVNNRDLKTLRMRPGHAAKLLPSVPGDRTRIAESGYRTREEILALERVGADGVLVGESLLRAPSLEEAYVSLFGEAARGESNP